MANLDNHRGESPRGLQRDMHQVRTHGNATMQELRDFLGSMRGKRPQEVLGLIAQSSLVQGMFWSSVIVLVAMVGFTFASWGYKKSRGDFEPVAKQQPAAQQQAADPAPAATEPSAGDAANAALTQPATAPPSGTDAPSATTPTDPAAAVADPLGIGETRLADPKVNPLESRGDDILSELNKP